MKKRITLKSYQKLSFALVLGLSFSTMHAHAANDLSTIKFSVSFDSVGTEIVNGNRFVIHQLKPKETYYQLSRLYTVPVKEIMTANNNKNLRIGDKVKIPRGKATEIVVKPKEEIPTSNIQLNPEDITEYKVGKSETLFSISRRFRVTVEDIKRVNGLRSDSVREGEILKIPKFGLPVEPAEEPVTELIPLPDIIEETQPIDDSMFKPNKYGIQEKKERGVGIWQESLGADSQTSLALHKTAPVGTILKITNPMNQSVTFAKVVGKFGENEDTQGAIVVLSKSVATSIGVLDKKFQVELTYGSPLEQ